jgi:hypothetical protein
MAASHTDVQISNQGNPEALLDMAIVICRLSAERVSHMLRHRWHDASLLEDLRPLLGSVIVPRPLPYHRARADKHDATKSDGSVIRVMVLRSSGILWWWIPVPLPFV